MKKTTLFMLVLFTITLQGQTKLLSSINENYDDISSTWEKSYGSNYEYDGNNNLITETYYNWDYASNVWEISDKTSYVYNPNNKVSEEFDYNWNSVTNLFEISYRILYTYNPSGNITEILDQVWSGSQWVNDGKTVITYNGNNLINMGISYEWLGSQWVNDYRSTITYNANNKIESLLDEEWISSSWVNTYRSFLTYNGNNKIMTSIGENWNGSIWENEYTRNFNYDANGNTMNYYDSFSFGQYKTEYNYDTAALMSSFAHPFKDKTGLESLFEEIVYVNKLLKETNFIYDNSSSSYLNNYRTIYNYSSSITLGIENFEISQNNLKIFPNPSKDFIQIIGFNGTENYEVYSVLGAKVNNGIIVGSEKIDIQNLTNGLYFLKFKNGNTAKFIKE